MKSDKPAQPAVPNTKEVQLIKNMEAKLQVFQVTICDCAFSLLFKNDLLKVFDPLK